MNPSSTDITTDDFFPTTSNDTPDIAETTRLTLKNGRQTIPYKGVLYLDAKTAAATLGVSVAYLRKRTNDYRTLPGCIMQKNAFGRAKWLIPETSLSFVPPKSLTTGRRTKTIAPASKATSPRKIAAATTALNSLEDALQNALTSLRALRRR